VSAKPKLILLLLVKKLLIKTINERYIECYLLFQAIANLSNFRNQMLSKFDYLKLILKKSEADAMRQLLVQTPKEAL